MSYKYSAIKLTDEISDYEVNGKSGEINSLSFINIFVGENNAGKSRFMRELSKNSQEEFQIQGLDFDQLKKEFEEFMITFRPSWELIHNTFAQSTIGGVKYTDFIEVNIDDYITNRTNKGFFENDSLSPTGLLNLLVSIRDNDLAINSHRGDWQTAQQNASRKLKENNGADFIQFLENFIVDKIDFDKYYIPTIRSLNNFSEYQTQGNVDIFKERTAKIYGFTPEHKVDIFTGQTIYTRIKSMLLGDIAERERMRSYEKFLKDKLFDGQEVVIIPKEGQDVVHVKIGNIEKPIYQLGDGIQSLIILTFPLYESEHGLFFIEEPEMNMHPGMQRKFIEALYAHPQHQYFITTHSNHMLDLTIDYTDISIFTFSQDIDEDKRIVEVVTNGDKNILDLLGARSTSVFLANKSIWVEGITDRLYLRKYLELYIEHNKLELPREDIDYVFVEYGGNNITHWSFLDSADPTINVDRLSNNLMVITDDDGIKKIDRKAELKSKLNERYQKLTVREIENTLTIRTLIKVIESYEKTKLKLIKIDDKNLKKSYLGDFIHDEIFLKNNIKPLRKGGYRADSGTIKSKLEFCHRATRDLVYEDLSKPAINIAAKIYDFIRY